MRFCFTLAVWGDWHLDQLARHGVPSLRAPGNLDAVGHHISAVTRPADLDRVRAALEGLDATVDAQLPDDVRLDQTTAIVLRRGAEDRAAAIAAGEAWGQLAPDMVWGEGTLAHHSRALEGGKKAIFPPLLRVDADRAGTIRNFGRRALARTALEHEHSVARSFYRADGEKFSPHSEMVIWEAPGGLLIRTVTAVVQFCAPDGVPISERGLSDLSLDGKTCVVGDSDEAVTLALSPLDQHFGALRPTGGPLTPGMVRAFLDGYPSPASRAVAARSYRLHGADVDPAAWADVERRADEFMREVFR